MAQIKIKRGLSAHLPNSAAAGEPLFATDTGKLYVGTGSNVKLINPDTPAVDGVSTLWRIGNTAHSVTRCNIRKNVCETLIKTKIPFISSCYMPVIHIKGFAYSEVTPFSLDIGYYIFNNSYSHFGAVGTGSFTPTVKLFTYVENGTRYTGIALTAHVYFLQFDVSVQNEQGAIYSTGWKIEYNESKTTSIIPTDDLVCVPYKYPSVINSKLNCSGGTMTGDLNMNGSSVSYIRPQTSGGWSRGFWWKNIDGTRIGGIGMLGHADTVSKFYMGYGKYPWDNSALDIYPTYINTNVTLKEKGHGVWHSGNFNPNALLNRSGGTMTGRLTIEGSAASQPLKVRGIQGKASYTDDDDALYLNYKNTHPVYINGKIAWHAGNFNPASKLDKNATIDAGTF